MMSSLNFFETDRRPVFKPHAQRKSARSEHFLDLVERLAAEIRSFQKLRLGALYQITDIVDIFSFQAIGRTHRKLEIIDRPQQNRVYLLRFGLLNLHRGALEIGKHDELVDEDARRIADRLLRLDRTVGFYVDNQFVEVGALFDAR